METQATKRTGTSANATSSFDYSKAEATVKNIVIPGSEFAAKWEEGKGYAIGYENIRITEYHKTLDKALNRVGYGVEKDKDDEEILVKFGETDFEMMVRIARAVNLIEAEKVTEIMKGAVNNG